MTVVTIGLVRRLIPSHFGVIESSGTRPCTGNLIVRVHKATFSQRKATAANTAAEASAQLLQSGNAGIQFVLPSLGEPAPVVFSRDIFTWKLSKDFCRQSQGYACSLCCPDDGYPAEH